MPKSNRDKKEGLRKILLLPKVTVLLTVWAILSTACDKLEPIKIGFVGGLTGPVTDLGTAGRDGVVFAVEEKNRGRGIRGRPIELLIRDDRQDPEQAHRVDRELIDEGVWAIVGHMTSAMSVAGVPIVNTAGTVMVSPTTSTNLLSGKDDFFFRVYPDIDSLARRLAEHAADSMGLRRVIAFYDLSNWAYTESYLAQFRRHFAARGGKIVRAVSFVSAEHTGFLTLARQVDPFPVDAIFILANAADTALLAQNLRKLGHLQPLLVSEWSTTEELLALGGKAVDGIRFASVYDRTAPGHAMQAFLREFEKRFGYPAGFASIQAYDAAQVVFACLEKHPDPRRLKQNLTAMESFAGLLGTFRFDRFGDVERPITLSTVRDGQFIRLTEE